VRQGGATLLSAVSNLLKYTPSRLSEDIRLGLRAQGLGGDVPPIEFVPHHVCHAYSAYFCSPFDEAVVLTLDGSGEDVCTQVAVGRGERLSVQETIPIPHSLGWFYAAFTAYLGFAPYRDEGKFMGLAGLGHARAADNPWPERLSAVLSVQDGSYAVDPTYTRFGEHSHAERFTDALAALITRFDPELRPVLPGECSAAAGGRSRYLAPAYVDLAWGVQALLEQAAATLAERAQRTHGVANLCVAGGVGLNCKMNGALLERTPFERIFVQPACYDAGAAIGAALVVAQSGGDAIRNTLRDAYLGPGWSPAEIGAVLDSCGLSAPRCEDVAARAAEEVAAGRVVGWFQGRMELGPRALGARSILASPRIADLQRRLNAVKGREPWRPFCPSILGEAFGELVEGADEAPFMTTAFTVRDARREALGPATHVDGTVRPQSVSREASPLFHRFLCDLRARTGLPFVINTSFNGSGEPIVCSPLEAVRAFYASGLDALAIGDVFLTKR
jgi:carbamoyltransferase